MPPTDPQAPQAPEGERNGWDALDRLDAEHGKACDRLRELLHRQALADLPEDYVPLSRSADPNLRPLHLSRRERLELYAETEIVQRRILRIAADIHQLRFGSVPHWLRPTPAPEASDG